jgi:tetratricopeptide (TPR) repeat protein
LPQAIKEYRGLLRTRPQDPQIRLELAQLLVQDKNYPEAIRELRTVLKQRPGDSQAAVTLGRIYLWTKKYPEAIRLFEGLKQRRLLAPDQLADLARAYAWDHQYSQAIAAYEDLLRSLPRPPAELYMELGDVHLYAQNLPAAIANYRQALKLDPASEAVRKKLALALSWNKQNQEALALLLPLQKKLPADKEIALELVRVYAKLGQLRKALALGRTLVQRFPTDADLLVEMGDLELGLGHAGAAKKYYETALRLDGRPDKLLLQVGDQMNFWGDFYRVEALYGEYLQRHPGDVKVWLKLAWALASSQRFSQADGIYRRLLVEEPGAVEPWLGLIKLRLAENDLQGALREARSFLETHKDHPEGLVLQGQALLRLQRYAEARETFRRLSNLQGYQVQGLLGRGKALLKQNRQSEAALVLNQTLRLEPQNLEARYYWLKAQSKEASKSLAGGPKTPMQWVQWAQLLAADGLKVQAIDAYQTALAQDPHCFPARLGLAEMLAAAYQYERALDILADLVADFPANSKILITRARVLSWSKRYDQAIEVYEQVQTLNPDDPLPAREMARTAAWGKMMPRAQRIYASLWEQPVDRKLLMALEALEAKTSDNGLLPLIEQVRKSDPDSIYQGYEAVSQKVDRLSANMSPHTRNQVELVLAELLPAYKVQKQAYLESQAKWLAWNKRLTPALDTYQDLTEFQPGNQEALFDYAQVECALGLCHREADTYRELLVIDPWHNLAGLALERQKIRRYPSIQLGHAYWEEQGQDERAVSQITRNITDITLDVPFRCQHHLRVSAHRWFERPKIGAGPFYATGHTLGVNGILNPYFRYDLSWTGKFYENGSIPDRHTGHVKFWFNLRDYANLGLGYERTNEIYNTFGIQQGTQADHFWVSLASYPTRKWAVEAQARYISFNDSNNEQVYSLATSYDFTDHPRVFRVKLKGEYRDTAELNEFIDRNDQLVNIIHPYWTPRNYLGGAVILEWYHDLSKFFFCGSEKHYYALRTVLSSDTTGNPGYGFEGEWNYEFRKHWSLNIKGFLNRSEQWDANAAWATIRYHF